MCQRDPIANDGFADGGSVLVKAGRITGLDVSQWLAPSPRQLEDFYYVPVTVLPGTVSQQGVDPRGGDFVGADGLAATATGDLIGFTARTVHQVAPVTAGHRLALSRSDDGTLKSDWLADHYWSDRRNDVEGHLPSLSVITVDLELPAVGLAGTERQSRG